MLTLLKNKYSSGEAKRGSELKGGVYILIMGICNLEIVRVFAWKLLNVLSGPVLLILVLVVFVKFKVF